MIKKLKKLIVSIMMVCLMAVVAPLGQMVSWADNTKISFSDPSVMVGNEVTVTMKVTSDSALGTAQVMLTYDHNILEFVSGTNANGGAGSIKVLGTMDSADQKVFRFTLKFKALQAGTTKINVDSQEIYDVDSKILNLSKQGNSTVKVTSPASYSKDAALKSLKISPGTLEPGFSASIYNYSAQVDADTADMVVNAVASNAGAKVTLEGEKGLKTGENKVVVTVTAEDGQTVKKYTISVTKAEGGSVPAIGQNGENGSLEWGNVTVTIDGKDYKVAKSFDESTLPEGFETERYQFKGNEVMAGKGLEKDILLLYLQDGEGKGGFFIYNEKADTWSQFIQVEATSKVIVIIPLDKDKALPEGFVERQVDIDGVQVTGWVVDSETEPEYCLFYAMNWNGEKHFYRYDLSEKTIQRYFAYGVSNEKFTNLTNSYSHLEKNYRIQFIILIAASILALILLIIVIVLVSKGSISKSNRYPKDGYGRGNRHKEDGDRFYDERQEERPAGRVKRYNREEFDNEYSDIQIDPEYFEDEMDEQDYGKDRMPDDNEDDFIIEESLEDMDRQFGYNQEEPPRNSIKNDDDFEFLDLD